MNNYKQKCLEQLIKYYQRLVFWSLIIPFSKNTKITANDLFENFHDIQQTEDELKKLGLTYKQLDELYSKCTLLVDELKREGVC